MEENKELYNLNSKLKKSITDSLTSYYNRHFLESLSENVTTKSTRIYLLVC